MKVLIAVSIFFYLPSLLAFSKLECPSHSTEKRTSENGVVEKFCEVSKGGRTFRTGPFYRFKKADKKFIFQEEGRYNASPYGTSKEILKYYAYNSLGEVFRSFGVEGTWVFVKESGTPERCHLISKNEFHDSMVGERISNSLGKEQLRAVAKKTQILSRGDISKLIESEHMFEIDCQYEGSAEAGFDTLRDIRQVNTNRGEDSPVEQNESENGVDKKRRAKQK